MNRVTEVTKRIILAGLGTIDEQNEEIKDLLKRGSVVMGMDSVDNEELLYNGNREAIIRKRKEKEKEENSLDLGNGRSLYYDSVKDEDGNVTKRNLELSKKPVYGKKEVSFDAIKEEDGGKKVFIHTDKNKDEGEAGVPDKEDSLKLSETEEEEFKGGVDNDKN